MQVPVRLKISFPGYLLGTLGIDLAGCNWHNKTFWSHYLPLTAARNWILLYIPNLSTLNYHLHERDETPKSWEA